MPSTFDPRLRQTLQAVDENPFTWGILANTNFELLADAIAGHINVGVGGSGNYNLTTLNGTVDQARYAMLRFTGVLTGNRTITTPSASKLYLVSNATTGAFSLTIKTSGGTGIVLVPGETTFIYCDGADIYFATPRSNVRLLNTSVVSPVAFVDLTLPSTFSRYTIYCTNIAYTNAATQTLNLRVSYNGGTTFDEGATDYSYYIQSSEATVNLTENRLALTPVISPALPINCTLTFTTNRFLTTFDYIGSNSSIISTGRGGGYRNVSNVANAIRLFPAGGTFASGSFTLIGNV